MSNHRLAHQTLQRAIDIAQNVGDSEAADLAALTILEELAEHLPPHDLSVTYDRAAELLTNTQSQEVKDRLLVASRRVLFLVGALPSPHTWKGFNFYDAVIRFEAGLIERRNLSTMLSTGRHKGLERLRTPVKPRRSSLMFRDEVDCPDTRAVSVLHVEDRPEVAEPVRMKLEDEGWSVEICATGIAALEKLESGERFDVLIFDYKLPDTTGIELIKQTRRLAHRQQTPIIMLSGDEVEPEAKRAGANYFLRKPGDIGSISETVARLLARRKGRES
jgi:CheY-like chemotaxis protein